MLESVFIPLENPLEKQQNPTFEIKSCARQRWGPQAAQAAQCGGMRGWMWGFGSVTPPTQPRRGGARGAMQHNLRGCGAALGINEEKPTASSGGKRQI